MHYNSFIPFPPDGENMLRWDFTRLARRILHGQWEDDLRQRVRKTVGTQREQAWGCVDISFNVFRTTIDNLAVLYDREPILTGDPLVLEEIRRTSFWYLMKRVQRDTLGLREMLIRIDTNSDGLLFRPVFPDMVIAQCSGDKPYDPVRIEELRTWEINGTNQWVWEVFDISDAGPYYRIELRDTNGLTSDVTAQLLGRQFEGEAYPYRYSDGTPYIPYVVYHAEHTGFLWDAYALKEIVEGTLNLAVKYSLLNHCITQASWPQRYAIGVQLAGNIDSEFGASEATVDPAMVVLFEPSTETAQPQIGQWQPGADPQALGETLRTLQRDLVGFAGVNPADLQRTSGDPRSGYALAISREAQRQAQRRYEGSFRRSDLELIKKSAALLSVLLGRELPTDGYTIAYQSIPRSPDEEQAIMERVQFLLSQGLITKERAFKELFPNEEYIPPKENP